MKHEERIPKPDYFKLKGYMTNAISDIEDTESEAEVPLASDESVEAARDWINENEL